MNKTNAQRVFEEITRNVNIHAVKEIEDTPMLLVSYEMMQKLEKAQDMDQEASSEKDTQ